MAAGSKGCIGFLPPASFCERVNSIAKYFMTDANTLMGVEALKMLVILQIHCNFMECMRSKYHHLTKQQFKMTVVENFDNANKKMRKNNTIMCFV